MTIYRTLDDLCNACAAAFEKHPVGELTQAQWFALDPHHVTLRDLFKTYFTALDNPPEGVIGVGAITYAEGVLAAAQEGTR